MPVFLTAQKYKSLVNELYGNYIFPEEHRKGWMAFWEANNGDIEKILKFAKSADIVHPEEWADSLYVFLFGTFWGNPKLLIQASSKGFDSFLVQVAKNHENTPKTKAWYHQHGVTQAQFITAIQAASEIADLNQSISYVNARIPSLGFYLYSEFLLAKTKQKDEIKSVASNMNEEAFQMECDAIEEYPEALFTKGAKVTHAFYPDTFTVEKFDPTSQVVEAKREDGSTVYFTDGWNLSRSCMFLF